MVSTFTPNIQLEEPARGDDVGTWDTPVNNNSTLIDLVSGGVTTISLNNSNVTLSAAQFQCSTIIFNSTLTANVVITFATSFQKPYTIYNACTGSSAFTITLTNSNFGTPNICAPPGSPVSIYAGATLFTYLSLPPIGTFLDYAGNSLPPWAAGSRPAPYLVCDGTTFASSTYPALSVILGGRTLPDFRGREPIYYNGGSGRTTSSGAGIDGNTLFATGGGNGLTLSASQIPTITSSGTNTISVSPTANSSFTMPFLSPTGSNQFFPQSAGSGSNNPLLQYDGTLGNAHALTGSNSIGVTYSNSSQAVVGVTVPTIVSGVRLIRAG